MTDMVAGQPSKNEGDRTGLAGCAAYESPSSPPPEFRHQIEACGFDNQEHAEGCARGGGGDG